MIRKVSNMFDKSIVRKAFNAKVAEIKLIMCNRNQGQQIKLIINIFV